MKLFIALVFIAMAANPGSAERLWANDITVGEYGMTWSYTETFTGIDSIAYRISVDEEFGNNDSFISAWELLEVDKEMRRRLGSSIESELDVRINNETAGIEVVDIDAELSTATIGKTHTADSIVNRYRVAYRWKDSIFNAESIWFLGQAESPVTITLPAGIDAVDISGMDNIAKNFDDNVEISGFFSKAPENVSQDRGEITLGLVQNETTAAPEVSVTNATLPESMDAAKSMDEVLSALRDGSILGAGILIVLLIYFFKLRK